jgi:perosamine synthetase
VTEQGYRYHLSNINAAIGLVQLKKFDVMNRRKIEIARRYDAAFESLPNIKLLKTPYEGLAFFTYIIRVLNDERESLMTHLKENGVDSGIHYIPAHHFSFFKPYAKRPLPQTETLYNQILTLPLYSEMTDDQVQRVTESISKWSSRSLV